MPLTREEKRAVPRRRAATRALPMSAKSRAARSSAATRAPRRRLLLAHQLPSLPVTDPVALDAGTPRRRLFVRHRRATAAARHRHRRRSRAHDRQSPETSSPADGQILSLGRVAVQRRLFPVVHSPNSPWQEGG
jgi:CBS-domain-containing membrane protein